MRVILTVRCRCGCSEYENVEHHWSPDVSLSWISDFMVRFYPGASYELRAARDLEALH